MWCNFCKNNTQSLRKKKGGKDDIRKVVQERHGDQDHLFLANYVESERPPGDVKMKGIMVDTGATSHILNGINTFKNFDSSASQTPTQWSKLMEANALE